MIKENSKMVLKWREPLQPFILRGKKTGINKFLVIIYPLLESRGGRIKTTDAVNILYVKVHY